MWVIWRERNNRTFDGVGLIDGVEVSIVDMEFLFCDHCLNGHVLGLMRIACIVEFLDYLFHIVILVQCKENFLHTPCVH